MSGQLSKKELPKVSIISVYHDWECFMPLLKHHMDTIDYPKDKLEWILVDDSKEPRYSDIPDDDNILYLHITADEYLQKIKFQKDTDGTLQGYYLRTKQVPIGFKRDFGCGMASNDYIFHLEYDCIYQPNAVKRKIQYLQDKSIECVYCKSMLCYDLYGKKVYKTEDNSSGYMDTLAYTREFWERSGGFAWDNISDSGTSFYYNKGMDRMMSNYYDTIKLLSIHNMNKYKPVEITLENQEVTIPEIVSTIQSNKHPLEYQLQDIFFNETINVLGINSDIVTQLPNDKWDITNIKYEKNTKEKLLLKEIQEKEKNFSLCFINTSFPIWKIFDKIAFPCIVIESDKNREQMDSILQKKDNLFIHNVYIHKKFIESIVPENVSENVSETIKKDDI